MITKKQFNKLLSEMEIGDKLIFKKSNGSKLFLSKINVLQYQLESDTIQETITNPQYDLLLR